jgi:hypothetical protein
VICLVPLLDMADHSPEQSVAWHTGREGGGNFEFVTQRPITRVRGLLLARCIVATAQCSTAAALLLATMLLLNVAIIISLRLQHPGQ